MIGFETLTEILEALGKNGHNLDATKKEELRVFLGKVLDGKEGETSENIVSAFREKLKTEAKNELKTEDLKAEAKNELKADQTLKDEVKNGLENEIKQKVSNLEKLENEKTQLQTEFDTANKKLKDQNAEVEKLTQKNKELENQKSQVQQPKPSNGAKYTATVGMGLAAGLIAFTALERTVKLEMLVMIGIAVTSALVVGGITYAALPSTQVDQTGTQSVKSANREV